jgi:hypothetical protein
MSKKIASGADGIVLDAQTIEHSETDSWGGLELVDGKFNSNFIGKNQTESDAVDTVAGTTNTTSGYKQAVIRCFDAFYIVVGGAE